MSDRMAAARQVPPCHGRGQPIGPPPIPHSRSRAFWLGSLFWAAGLFGIGLFFWDLVHWSWPG